MILHSAIMFELITGCLVLGALFGVLGLLVIDAYLNGPR